MRNKKSIGVQGTKDVRIDLFIKRFLTRFVSHKCLRVPREPLPAVDDLVKGDVMLVKLPVESGADVDKVGDERQRSARFPALVGARLGPQPRSHQIFQLPTRLAPEWPRERGKIYAIRNQF